MSDFPSIGCHYPLSRKIRVYDPSPLLQKGGGVSAVFRNKREKLGKLSVASRPFTSPIWDMIICDSTKREKKRKVFLCRRLLLWLSSLPLSPREVQVTSKIFLFLSFSFPLLFGKPNSISTFFKKKILPSSSYVRLRTYVVLHSWALLFLIR